ncbi:hypothetical protein C8Q80DRAFT_1352643 [Daedaleopsis nitida]|nr:hypothetical protein C8Q80DRAFT_1352643 [Daedaleopsis nitida]
MLQTTVAPVCFSETSSRSQAASVDMGEIVAILQQDDVLSIRKLIMRRRPTSPYQIKLPFTSERYAIKFVKSTPLSQGRPEEEPETHSDTTHRPADSRTDAQVKPSSPATPKDTDLTPTNEHPPLLSRPTARRLLSTTSVIGTRPDPSQALNRTDSAPLPPSATWEDICKDLSCAMEILAVLSDVTRNPTTPAPATCSAVTTVAQLWPARALSQQPCSRSGMAAVDTKYSAGFEPFGSSVVYATTCAFA